MDCQGRGTTIQFIHYRETLYHLIGFVLFLIFVLVSSVIFLRRENAVPATAG